MNLTENTVNQISKHHPRSVNFFQYTSIAYTAEKQSHTVTEKIGCMGAKSFLLETIRFYPSNRSLSYWKHLASIRQIFCPSSERKIGGWISASGTVACSIGYTTHYYNGRTLLHARKSAERRIPALCVDKICQYGIFCYLCIAKSRKTNLFYI